jgi:hypothetical protein
MHDLLIRCRLIAPGRISRPLWAHTQNEPGGFITRGGLEPNPLKLNIP